jgi:hypothetical protein
MARSLTLGQLRSAKEKPRNLRRIDMNVASQGFVPAFLDTESGMVYLSRHTDGNLALLHVLDGLPPDLIEARSATGKPTVAKTKVLAGFVREGRFYSRDEAQVAASAEGTHPL